VVPPTLLLNATVVVFNEQILCAFGVAVAEGIGLTVIVAVIGVPEQVPALGVMV
jgi:hypothetical protein